MSKLVMTGWQEDQICSALTEQGKVIQLSLESRLEDSLLNSIYIGKVQNVVKNINAAFIAFGEDQVGYYSLSENRRHLYVNPSENQERMPHNGDELVIQVSRDAVKTKAPVLTGQISMTGKYAVVTWGKSGIGFSSKLTNRSWKDSCKAFLLETLAEDSTWQEFGVIIRTNGAEASFEELLMELKGLKAGFDHIVKESRYRSCYQRLSEAQPGYLSKLRDTYTNGLEEILTDDPVLYEQMKAYLTENQPEDLGKLTLYQDPLLPLKKLYKLEQAFEEALSKRVWLKSGGYLVIEPTEALVVIDVNTGKYSGKKTMRETILKINLEAADEIAKQLRLRNLSGIMVVDFIDMEAEEDRQTLLECLGTAVRRDPVKTTVVGISKLNLVEMTRKKVHRPLYEQAERVRKA